MVGRLPLPLSLDASKPLIRRADRTPPSSQTLSYLRRAHFHPVDPPPLLVPKSKRISQKDLAESYRGPSLIQYTEPGISTG